MMVIVDGGPVMTLLSVLLMDTVKYSSFSSILSSTMVMFTQRVCFGSSERVYTQVQCEGMKVSI